MCFYEISLASQWLFFVEMLYTVHYSNNLFKQNKETPPNVKTITFLTRPKLLLKIFSALNFSSIKLKWLVGFLYYVLHLHFRHSDFRSQTIFLEVNSETVLALFIPFSLLFKIDSKFLIPQAFFSLLVFPCSIYSIGTKILLFFLRQTPTEQWGASCELCM